MRLKRSEVTLCGYQLSVFVCFQKLTEEWDSDQPRSEDRGNCLTAVCCRIVLLGFVVRTRESKIFQFSCLWGTNLARLGILGKG